MTESSWLTSTWAPRSTKDPPPPPTGSRSGPERTGKPCAPPQGTSVTNSWTISHTTTWNKAGKNSSPISRTSWRSTSLRSLSPAASIYLGCRHRWRGWLRRRVACTRRPRRSDPDGTTTLSLSDPPREPLNRHTGSMSMESSLQASEKVTVNPSGDSSRACVKTARAFLHWSLAPINTWATSSALSSPMTTPLKRTTCYMAHSTPQSDPWKFQNLESVSFCGIWTLEKQQDLTRLQPESWRNSRMTSARPLLPSSTSPSTPVYSLAPGRTHGWRPSSRKETRNDPASYRPVSLTSIICKVAEHIICSHVRDHLDEHQILSDAHHGFRQGHSCETQLLLTTHDLLKHHDHRHQVDVGILDFSKALDTVPHRRLISKLRLYRIDGRILLWIQAFLSDRRQLVLCDGVKSQFVPVTSGVPQGTVLGPLLFLLHINDLPSVVDPNTPVRLFADDALVYRVINTIQDQVTLQQDLARLEGWAKAWGMVFNASKCYVMHIHHGNSTKSYFYQICGEFLSPVTNEKYLGVHITQDLNWSLHIDRVATKASQKLGFIRHNLRGAPAQCKQLAYIALVRSGMEYASTIWHPHTNVHSNKLEKNQRRAARWATSQYSHRTSVTSLMDQLKWQPLEDRRRIQRPAFLYKILHHKVAVPMSSIDLVYNPRPARGKDTNQSRLQITRASTDQFRKSFGIQTVKDWNALPQSTISAAEGSEASFKSQLSGSNP